MPMDSPQPQASPSTLAGGAGGESTPQYSQEGQTGNTDGLKQIMTAVHGMQQQTMELARQFPAASKALRQVEEGLRAALRQIIANPGTPEPSTPDIGG